jgi:hypothetical protein
MRGAVAVLPIVVFACSSEDGSTATAAGGGGSSDGGAAFGGSWAGGGTSGNGGTNTGGSAADAGFDAGTSAPVIETIHDHHRYIATKMFGGWGPHLGHLLRAPESSGNGSTLWLADDHCAQPGSTGTPCDVNHDHTLGYFERTPSGWIQRHTIALPGTIQQNTGSIVSPDGTKITTFGLDIAGNHIIECNYDPKTGPLGCNPLTFTTLLPSSNYMGAAISPQGHRLVWWTTVVDNGAGSFHYIVDYGGGWNGPRSGDCGGYNDASYINIAFGGVAPSDFTMHAQLVSGAAPNWSFLGAIGQGNLSTTDPVSWQNALSVTGDTVSSTNDIWTDAATGDTHVIARTTDGAAPYFHRPAGGAWSGATFVLPATYRARFVPTGDRLFLIYGPAAGGLAYRVAEKADRVPGAPIAWDSLAESHVELPADFGMVMAIYPESPVYQPTSATGAHVAIVGETAQWSVTHVQL